MLKEVIGVGDTELEALKNEKKQLGLDETDDVEFELISKLIIEIEANKHYTNSSAITKAFDRVINQGWLHFKSIEKGLNNED